MTASTKRIGSPRPFEGLPQFNNPKQDAADACVHELSGTMQEIVLDLDARLRKDLFLRLRHVVNEWERIANERLGES